MRLDALALTRIRLNLSERRSRLGAARLEHIPGFNIDRVAAAAGDDPDVLRLENLDTDIPPPAEAIEATRALVDVGLSRPTQWPKGGG